MALLETKVIFQAPMFHFHYGRKGIQPFVIYESLWNPGGIVASEISRWNIGGHWLERGPFSKISLGQWMWQRSFPLRIFKLQSIQYTRSRVQVPAMFCLEVLYPNQFLRDFTQIQDASAVFRGFVLCWLLLKLKGTEVWPGTMIYIHIEIERDRYLVWFTYAYAFMYVIFTLSITCIFNIFYILHVYLIIFTLTLTLI